MLPIRKKWQDILFEEGLRKKEYADLQHKKEQVESEINSATHTLTEEEYIQNYIGSKHLGKVILIIMALVLCWAGVSFFTAAMKNGTSYSAGSAMVTSLFVVIITPIVALIVWALLRRSFRKDAKSEYHGKYIPKQEADRAMLDVWQQQASELENHAEKVKEEFILPVAIHPYLSRIYVLMDNKKAKTIQEAILMMFSDINDEVEYHSFIRSLQEAERRY